MMYLPELYYFWDQPGLDFWKAYKLTVKVISQWNPYYRIDIDYPIETAVVTSKSGEFPADRVAREKLIDELFDWLQTNINPQLEEIFTFELSDKPLTTEPSVMNPEARFTYNEVCCWGFDLTDEQFQELQKTLKENDLPEDLFYHQDKEVFVGETDENGMQLAGKYYTPKRWEREQGNLEVVKRDDQTEEILKRFRRNISG